MYILPPQIKRNSISCHEAISRKVTRTTPAAKRSLRIGPREFAPRLIIFDKDGTLIDFHHMWAAWLTQLAQQIEAAAGVPLAAELLRAMGFDPETQRVDPRGRLALLPMDELRRVTAGVLRESGVAPARVEEILAAHWRPPDPLALAKPVADLAALFGALRARGIVLALATSDDRAPTETLLRELGLSGHVAALVCADDGLPIKPAADMILHLCRVLAIAPAEVMMVGDSVDDLRMGRAAGVGMTVGVLSGLSSVELLEPFADVVIPSVASLLPSLPLPGKSG